MSFGLANAGLGLASQLIGTKQIGPAAPAYQPGVQGGLNQLTAMGQDNINMMPGLLEGRVASPVQDAISALPETPAPEEVGPPVSQAGPAEPPGFGDAFFGSLDSSLGSPAKLIGMGLLNQQVNGLGTGLMLGKGLLDAFRR